MLSLEMSRDDWGRLSEFVEAANQLRKHLLKSKESGKQQVTINAEPVDAFLSVDVPPEFWLRLGSLLGEKLRERTE